MPSVSCHPVTASATPRHNAELALAGPGSLTDTTPATRQARESFAPPATDSPRVVQSMITRIGKCHQPTNVSDGASVMRGTISTGGCEIEIESKSGSNAPADSP